MTPSQDPPPHPAHDELLREWVALLRRTAEAGGPDPVPYGEDLLGRWRQSHRRYHTTDHLAAVLGQVDRLERAAADPNAVRLAAWFHDAVYRPDRSENEERSAALAERALHEAGLAPERVAEVARLVRLTATHDPAAGDRNGQVLCDADLAVLASPPAAYAAYAAAVRAEYAFVPEPDFRAGRADILRSLLAHPTLFHTPAARERWEAAARRNLAAELAAPAQDMAEPATPAQDDAAAPARHPAAPDPKA